MKGKIISQQIKQVGVKKIYSGLHSVMVHLRWYSGSMNAAAIQTKPKGFTSLAGKPLYFLLLCFCTPLLLGSSAPLIPYPATDNLNQQIDNIRINNGTQGEQRDEADRLVRQGSQQQHQGNLEKAISYWWQALEIYDQIGDVEAVGRTYDFIGLAYGELRRYPEAEDAFRRRLAVARSNKDLQGQIFGLNNLGSILLERQNFPEARTTFAEALAISRSVRNFAVEGASLSNLGRVAAVEKDYDRAIKLYEAAATLRRRGNDPLGEANTFNNLGDAYLAIHRYSDSIGAYGAALGIARERRAPNIQFRAIDGLVVAHGSVGRTERWLQLLQERLAIARETENLHQQLKSLQLLAQFYQKQGNYAEAARAYHQAIAIAHILHAPEHRGTAGNRWF
ncbi:tetratricopeptide repeat protein [Microseira sp. BLCC-F43]|jgi:tetratricopeptide (TPR) repeat protein|uniref:tetratricopeptide repeat protein n=1 Tax=Microseira sp. BLCC-F43 TaxID=3153602 RepID=UPI0035B78216